MVSWEFPPQLVGGLGRHVSELAPALAAAGHEVRVLTRGSLGWPVTERFGPVTSTGAARTAGHRPGRRELLAWSQAFEHR